MEYTQIMQKMLTNNSAAAEAIVAGARAEQIAAAAELQETRRQLTEMEQNKVQILQEYTTQLRAQLENYIRLEILEEMAEKLLKKGESLSVVGTLLGLAERVMQSVFRHSGLQQVGSANAWLEYEEDGRSGSVIFHHGKTTNRFYYEFGGDTTLVIIDIPTAAQWETRTGLPLAERELILDFIGKKVVADKAPGYSYRVENSAIVIYI